MGRPGHFITIFTLLCFFVLLYLNCNPFTMDNSRLETVPLQRPDRLFEMVEDIGILKVQKIKFLPNFKNPCWYESRGGISGTSEKQLHFHVVKTDLQHKDDSSEVLRCLPYFFLIGQPKCATTDIFHRINNHPDVAEPLLKGPNWWTRKRFGEPYASHPVPLTEYIDLFNASKIRQNSPSRLESQSSWEYNRITGDGSTSTLWDSSHTMAYLHHLMTTHHRESVVEALLRGRKEANSVPYVKNSSRVRAVTYESVHSSGLSHWSAGQKGIVLPFTVADVIHLLLPDSQIIAVFREPVSRLYSSYLFFTKKVDLSPQHFDIAVRSSIKQWNACIKQYSDRICAYNKTLQNIMGVRLYNGLYNIYIKDWLQVFPRRQMLVLRMEDYHKNLTKTLGSIYRHLKLRPPTSEESKSINVSKVYNKNRKKSSVGAMLNSTRKILQDFYKPYNRDLANLLNDSKFKWSDI